MDGRRAAETVAGLRNDVQHILDAVDDLGLLMESKATKEDQAKDRKRLLVGVAVMLVVVLGVGGLVRESQVSGCRSTMSNTKALSGLLDQIVASAENQYQRAVAGKNPTAIALASQGLRGTQAFVMQQEAMLPHPDCKYFSVL